MTINYKLKLKEGKPDNFPGLFKNGKLTFIVRTDNSKLFRIEQEIRNILKRLDEPEHIMANADNNDEF